MYAVIVAWSQSRILKTEDLTEAIDYAKIHQPTKVYVMDLCKVELVFKNWENESGKLATTV